MEDYTEERIEELMQGADDSLYQEWLKQKENERTNT